MVVRTQTEKVARVRRGVMELYISDHPLDCLTCAANGGTASCRTWLAPWGCATCATPRATTTSARPRDESKPLLHLRPFEMHRLLPLRACMRRGAGHLRPHHRRTRVRVQGGHRRRRLPRFGMASPAAPACRLCPTATLMEKSVIDHGVAGPHRIHHLRLLRRRLLVPCRDEGRSGGADGSAQGRQGQPRPFLRQGPLRLGLRQPQGPHHDADGAGIHRRSVAGSGMGRGHRLRGNAS